MSGARAAKSFLRKPSIAMMLTLVVGVAAASGGCPEDGQANGGSPEGKTLAIGSIRWAESVTTENLSAVLLARELGYRLSWLHELCVWNGQCWCVHPLPKTVMR